jgi:hypothetical protein
MVRARKFRGLENPSGSEFSTSYYNPQKHQEHRQSNQQHQPGEVRLIEGLLSLSCPGIRVFTGLWGWEAPKAPCFVSFEG